MRILTFVVKHDDTPRRAKESVRVYIKSVDGLRTFRPTSFAERKDAEKLVAELCTSLHMSVLRYSYVQTLGCLCGCSPGFLVNWLEKPKDFPAPAKIELIFSLLENS